MIAGTEGLFADFLNSENRDIFAIINSSETDEEMGSNLHSLALGDGVTVGTGQFSVVHYFGKLRLTLLMWDPSLRIMGVCVYRQRELRFGYWFCKEE
jgi:hypothetical protein